MERNVGVLLVGSLGVDDLIVRTELERGSFQVRFGKSDTIANLEDRLAKEHWDVVILGLERGLIRGLDLIRLLKQSYPQLPIIVVSAEMGVPAAVAAMKAGADDYLLKDAPSAILPAVESVLSKAHNSEQNAGDLQSEEAKTHLAHSVQDVLYEFDAQTGIVHIQDQFGAVFQPGESDYPINELMNGVIAPEDHFRLIRQWVTLPATDSDLWFARYNIQSHRGTTTAIEDHGYIERDAYGVPVRIVGVAILGQQVKDPRSTFKEDGGESGVRYESLFESMREGILISSLDGTIVEANPAAHHILGLNEDALLGVSIADVLFRPCGCMDYLDALHEGGETGAVSATINIPGRSGKRHLLIQATLDRGDKTGSLNVIVSDITGLKDAEHALHQSERQLRGIVNTARVIIILLSPEGDILEWNNEAERLFGVPRSNAVAKNYFDAYLSPEEMDTVKLEFARVLQGRNEVAFEHHISSVDRQRRLVRWSASTLPGAAENAVDVVMIGTDVTVSRHAEQLIKEKEANLSAVIENTKDSIWSIDTDYMVRTINSVFQNKFKVLYDVELHPGMRIIDFIPDHLREFWVNHYNKALNGESYTVTARFKWNQEPRDYDVSFNPIYEGRKITGVSVFARDITERVRDTNALLYLQRRDMLISTVSRSFLNEPLDEVDQTIEMALQECTEFVRAEGAFLAVVGDNAERPLEGICHYKTEFLDKYISALFEPGGAHQWQQGMSSANSSVTFASPSTLPEEAADTCRLLVSAGVTSAYMLPLRSHDRTIGVLCVLCTSSERTWDSDDDVLFRTLGELIANVLDRKQAYDRVHRERMMLTARVEESTSELRTVNAELARAARMKDEFFANMSHELRTPLTAILGMTESLQEQIAEKLSDKQRNALRVIDESGRHLYSLINDILDLSKIEAGHLTVRFDNYEVDLLCKSSLLFVRQMALKKSIRVEYKNPDPKLLLYTDGTRFKQVLVNLLNNAVKFTPEGGSVSLFVRPFESRNEVEFEVRDTGIGIEERHMSRLFKPFVQLDSTLSRQYEGTGLGLALVASLTDMLGGSVSVESSIRAGSSFTVTLPLASDRKDMPGEHTHGKGALTVDRSNPPAVLLVEDNESNVVTIQHFLQELGLHVMVCREGFEVWAYLADFTPDLIVLDLQMPGISGTEIIYRIRSEEVWRHIPVLLLSALAMPGDKERYLNAGADGYLLKPLRLDDLRNEVAMVLSPQRRVEEV